MKHSYQNKEISRSLNHLKLAPNESISKYDFTTLQSIINNNNYNNITFTEMR